jgi:integrase
VKRPAAGRCWPLTVRKLGLPSPADEANWSKKSYNNAIGVLRRAFKFGYRDYPEERDPTSNLRSARIRKQDRPVVDPFTIQDAEAVIAAIHRDWGNAQGNYDEFRFSPPDIALAVLKGFSHLTPHAHVLALKNEALAYSPTHPPAQIDVCTKAASRSR